MQFKKWFFTLQRSDDISFTTKYFMQDVSTEIIIVTT